MGWKGWRKLGDFVVENSGTIAAVISIAFPGFGTAIGNAMGLTGTAATIAGAATINAGVTALNPNATGKDILKAAAAGGAGAYAGNVVGQKVGAAAGGGATGRVLGSAAGGGAGAATSAIVQGAEPDEALKAGLRGAATAGLTQTGVEGARSFSTQGPQQAGEARLRVPAQGTYQRGAPIAQAPSAGGFTGQMISGGGAGFSGESGALYSTNLPSNPAGVDSQGNLIPNEYQRELARRRLAAPSQTLRATESGVRPDEAALLPSSLRMADSTYRQTPEFKPPSLTRREEDLLRESLGEAFQYLFRDKPQTEPESPTQLGSTRRLGAPLTQASPGSQALAQALRIGDIGVPVFGGEKEEGRRSGWNVESLRYMGNSEA
jgi:hypothetical protein